MAKGSVLITGGAGFLGKNLCSHLSEEEASEIVSLDLSGSIGRSDSRIRVVRGDIRNRESIESLTKNISCIVHAASALPNASRSVIYSTIVDGTKNLLRAAEKNGIQRFIYISSGAIRCAVPDLIHPYCMAKILAEKACDSFRSRMCVTILRPQTIVGPARSGFFEFLIQRARSGKPIPLIGGGENYHQFIDVVDLCEAIRSCVLGLPKT